MSEINIMDFDPSSSIKSYNFTNTAIRRFYDTIDSEQFKDEKKEKIFEYLTGEMEIVPFNDQLKRYLYEKNEMQEAFRSVTNEQYVALILDGFEKNDCLASVGAKTKQEMKRKANRWIAAESVKRESIFQMGFGLDMDDQTISKFLTLVLKEGDFDFYDPKEIVYWHCRRTGKSYAAAEKLLEEYAAEPSDTSVRKDHMWEAMQNTPKLYVSTEDGLKKYLHYIKNLNIADKRENRARQVFERLYERAKETIAKHMNRYPDEKEVEPRRFTAGDISAGKIESVLYTEVPVTKNGNMKSFACLKKQFSGKRLSRERISKVLAGKPVERFDLITLIFLIYALDDEKLESGAGPRFSAFAAEWFRNSARPAPSMAVLRPAAFWQPDKKPLLHVADRRSRQILRPTDRRLRHRNHQSATQVRSRQRFLTCHNIVYRTGCHDFSTMLSGSRSDIHDIVRRAHGIFIMFYYN